MADSKTYNPCTLVLPGNTVWRPTHRFTEQPVSGPHSELSWFTLMATSDEHAYRKMLEHDSSLGLSQLQRRVSPGVWEFTI